MNDLLTNLPIWGQLTAYIQGILESRLPFSTLKCTSPLRFEVAGLSIDLSKNYWDDRLLQLFSKLADVRHLSEARRRLFQGERVNVSEQRAAWHTLLRDPLHQTASVKASFAKLREWEKRCQQSSVTDIVHIGMGGSFWGPALLCDTFSVTADSTRRCHFVESQPPAAIDKLLKTLNPETTWVLVVSKSFQTVEVLDNAARVTSWLQSTDSWQQQLFAVTAHCERAIEWGVDLDHIFPIWDWLGGRFSIWSAVSASVIFAYGWDVFARFLEGAQACDEHFKASPWVVNVPVLMGLIGILYRHFFNAQTQAIIPYHDALSRLPGYLQQLHMESLGKQVTQSGKLISYPTGSIIWGGVGPGSQHSFHQLLLQGADCIPVDFIVVENNGMAYQYAQAQAKALAEGNGDDVSLSTYQRLSGNRPSQFISMSGLTPENLGALLALYEHKVYTQSVIWDINAFDQWGVELAKQINTLDNPKNRRWMHHSSVTD